ncbi:MAG: GNAT family N-acetyltransferase [Bacteroidota bacterium]
MLKGTKIKLRAVEPNDATLIYLWENDVENWKFTNTDAPLSMFEIYQLIEEQRAVRESGQLRLMILELESDKILGAVDLYNIDFKHGFGTVGILIAEQQNREQGFALESLLLLAEYAKTHLNLSNLSCGIQSSNLASQRLFEKAGFLKIGMRKNWFLVEGNREDEYIYQLEL